MAGVLMAVLSHFWARKWYRNRYGIVIEQTGARSTSPWQGILAVLIFGLASWTILFRLHAQRHSRQRVRSYVSPGTWTAGSRLRIPNPANFRVADELRTSAKRCSAGQFPSGYDHAKS